MRQRRRFSARAGSQRSGEAPGGRCAGQAAQSPPGGCRATEHTCLRSPARLNVTRAERHGEPAREGSGFSLSPQGAVLPPAPVGFGHRAEPLPRCPGQQQPAMRTEPQGAASSSRHLALLPDPARRSGSMGDPWSRSDPTPATHLGSQRVPGEEGVKLSQHRQKSEDCRFVAGLSHLSPAQRRALSRAGLSAKSPPLH